MGDFDTLKKLATAYERLALAGILIVGGLLATNFVVLLWRSL